MKNKKVFLFSGVLLSVVLLLSFLGIVRPQNTANNPAVVQENQSTKSDVSLAIVNEDSGMVYNGDNVTMANVLIDSLSRKTPYKIETVSRSIAEKGLEAGTYQVLVIIPSHFSQDALALESVEPKRALFQYKIKADKQVLVKQAEQAVSDLKQVFNQDMIRIYFGSVVSNLQTAQEQVAGVINHQGSTSNQFNATLLDPLRQYSEQFKGLSSSTQSVTSLMNGFNAGIQNSNNEFTQIISVDKTYDTELATIKGLQDSWTASMLNREKLAADYDASILKLTVDPRLVALNTLNNNLSQSLNDNQDIKTVVSNATDLNARLETFTTEIKGRNEEINLYLTTTYKEKIKQVVSDSLAEKDGAKASLGVLVTGLRNHINSQIRNNASQIVLYDDATIDRMQLSDSDKQFLKNTVRFVKELNPSATVTTNSHYDSFIQDKQNKVRDTLSGQIIVKNVKGDINNIYLHTDSRYSVTALSINGKAPVFTKTGTGVNVTGGFDTKSTELVVTYELQNQSPNADGVGWFAPIQSTVEVVTKESISHLDAEQQKELLAQVDLLNDSITKSNTVINAFNAYQQSGGGTSPINSNTDAGDTATQPSATKQVFDVLTPLPVNTLKINTTAQDIERNYKASEALTEFTDAKSFISELSPAVYNDVKSYLDFAGQVKSVYGLDLYTQLDASPSRPNAGSLYDQLALERLDEILVDIVTATITADVTEKLVIPDEWTQQVGDLKANISGLQSKIDGFQGLMVQANTEIGNVITETEEVQKTLASKPVLVESEKRDNTELTDVSLSINKDLSTLMSASKALLDKTKDHQQVSDNIQKEYERLNEQVKSLEEKGTEYQSTVSTMNAVMEKEYASNNDFLKEFEQVMANTKSGNTDNSLVYDYLSSPIDGVLVDSRMTGGSVTNYRQQMDNRSGVLVVLIIAIMTLAFVYMLKHGNWQILNTKQYRRATNNMLPLILLSSVGSLIGLIVGIVVGYKLKLPTEQVIALSGVALIIGLSLIFMNHALINWLKSYGLLISLIFVMVYIISLGQLFDTYYGSVNPFLTYLTPLVPAENIVHTIINNQPTAWLSLGMLIIVGIISFVMSALHYKRNKE